MQKSKYRLKKLAKDFLWIFTALLLCEIGSWLYLRNRVESRAQLEEKYQKELSNLDGMAWSLKLKAHPYFGYVCDDQMYTQKCNNYGFRNDQDFPLEKMPGDYVIGVFGGSVANWLAQYLIDHHDVYEARLKKNPYFKDKRIRFVSFAMAGYKQPQSYFVAAYFHDTIDAALFLDGGNEIAETPFPVQPLDYPKIYMRLFEDPAQDFWRKKMVTFIKTVSFEWTKSALATPLMSRSYFHALIWMGAQRFFTSEVSRLGDDMMMDRDREPQTHRFGQMNLEERTLQLVKIWSKYTTLSHELFKNKKMYFRHYVQPSAYIENSKIMTEAERNIAVTSYPDLALVRKFGGDNILKEQKLLQEKSVATSSLAYIFKNVAEPVYIDDFYHVNDLGNKIISDKIIADMAEGCCAKR